MPTTSPTNDATSPARLTAAGSRVEPMHVVVVLPEQRRADDPVAMSQLSRHANGRYRPYPTYLLHARAQCWAQTHRSAALWNVVHRVDGVTVAAGGPLRSLDLPGLERLAGWQAHLRWQAWRTHVAAGTPRARDWESFTSGWAQPRDREWRAASPDEARRRFEAQPRVLAMLAVNSRRILPFPLDLGELAAFQAGESVYCTLAAQQAVVGQLLVLPGGFAYRPVTTGLADRLRYLRAALDAVHSLNPDQHLAALTRTPTP